MSMIKDTSCASDTGDVSTTSVLFQLSRRHTPWLSDRKGLRSTRDHTGYYCNRRVSYPKLYEAFALSVNVLGAMPNVSGISIRPDTK